MKISTEVMAVLSVSTTDGNKLTLNGELDRKLYTAVNKALEAAGGKWNRKLKAHVFDSDAADRVDQMLTTGSIEIPKDDFDYFPTPECLALQMVDLGNIESGMSILEPSAGQGAIIKALVSSADDLTIDAYELSPVNNKILNDEGISSLTVFEPKDFLTVDPIPKYDRVIMNPPFGKQNDVKHVNHALKFLKPGGLLVSIMSASVTFRNNKLTIDFRNTINERGGYIKSLPEGSFKSSGTMVNTVVAVIPG